LARTESAPHCCFVPAVSPVPGWVATSPTSPASPTCAVFAAAAQSGVGGPRRTAYCATPPLPSDTAVHRRVIDVSPRSTTARSVTRLGLAGGFSGLVISTRAESGAHPAAAAVINTVPAARAMSLPIESTVAMDGLDDAHSIFAFR